MAKHKDWLVPTHFDPTSRELRLSIHSWLVRAAGQCILVDTCYGNQKQRVERPQAHMLNGSYLQRLAEAGVHSDEIDIVLCTHLHYDHVGWNTRLVDGRWVPTFRNARYLFSRIDRDHFEAVSRDPTQPQIDRGAYVDSVLPILEAGQAELVEGVHELGPSLMIEPAPGHTPGHVVLKIVSRNERAVLCGDVLHYPLQIFHPEMKSLAVVDVDQELTTRKRILCECAELGSLLLPGHFAEPHAAYITSNKGEFGIDFARWV